MLSTRAASKSDTGWSSISLLASKQIAASNKSEWESGIPPLTHRAAITNVQMALSALNLSDSKAQ